MEKIKSILDREQISTTEIRSNQDFGKILNEVKLAKSPFYKTHWFYGTIGLATIAGAVGVTVFSLTDDMENTVASKNSQNAEVVQVNVENKLPKTESILIADAGTAGIEERPTVTSPHVDRVVVPIPETSAKNNSNANNTQAEVVVETSEPKEVDIPVVRRDATSYGHVMGHYPSIANVQRGTISIENLCSNSKIESDGVVITSFSILYYDGHKDVEQTVKGNEIPAEICKAIESYNLKNYIFFTNIRGISERGEEVLLTNFSLLPTK